MLSPKAKAAPEPREFLMALWKLTDYNLAVGQTPVPLVNIKIGGKWMFIQPKMARHRLCPVAISEDSSLAKACGLQLLALWKGLLKECKGSAWCGKSNASCSASFWETERNSSNQAWILPQKLVHFSARGQVGQIKATIQTTAIHQEFVRLPDS